MKKLLIILMALACQGCVYFNYATRPEGDAVLCEIRSPYMRGDKWQFYTALYDEDNVYVTLHHLARRHSRDGLSDFHELYLLVTSSKELEARIVPGTLSMRVETEDGKQIESIEPPYSSTDTFWSRYPLDIPKSLVEHISFELDIGGRRKSFNYRFPVVRKLNYTYWSVMMGV